MAAAYRIPRRLTFFCITLVRLRTKFPYHFDSTVMAGTEMKARIVSCQEMKNMNINTPMAWTNDRRKTFTLSVT
jgi:hypothetical protein